MQHNLIYDLHSSPPHTVTWLVTAFCVPLSSEICVPDQYTAGHFDEYIPPGALHSSNAGDTLPMCAPLRRQSRTSNTYSNCCIVLQCLGPMGIVASPPSVHSLPPFLSRKLLGPAVWQYVRRNLRMAFLRHVLVHRALRHFCPLHGVAAWADYCCIPTAQE